jgi:NAD(P)-dependent dehydrogenase (short-subunit alcohol dehydrogenase family)
MNDVPEGNALQGKVALVTAASQGIGLASASALAADGAAVMIMGRRPDALRDAQLQLRQRHPDARIELFAGDATDEAVFQEALSRTHALEGRLDIIASVVGQPTFKPLLMREIADVRAELELNFFGAFLSARYGAPLMERGGAIVCMSSIGSTQTTWGLSIYGAAKAALERFVRSAAFELGGAGIRINALRPGATIPPERIERQPEIRATTEAYADVTPLGRLGHPDDVARAVRFLAGPESGWVTGQTFSVDGGLDQAPGPDFMDQFFGKETMDAIREGKTVSGAAVAS